MCGSPALARQVSHRARRDARDCWWGLPPTDSSVSEIPHLSFFVSTEGKKNLMTEVISPPRHAALQSLHLPRHIPSAGPAADGKTKSRCRTQRGISSSHGPGHLTPMLEPARPWPRRHPGTRPRVRGDQDRCDGIKEWVTPGEAQP